MQIIHSEIEGLFEIRPDVFKDSRGFFVETWQGERYKGIGIEEPFVQDNRSFSYEGVLRGLHYRKSLPMGKLVSVVAGKVFDVAVDLRKGSSAFGKFHSVILDSSVANQLWIPAGFAHGFLTLSSSAEVLYKCTDIYRPEDEGIIRWNDPDLNIPWPLDRINKTLREPILSAKDKEAPSFADFLQSLK